MWGSAVVESHEALPLLEGLSVDGVGVGGRSVWRGRESTLRDQVKSWEILEDRSSRSCLQEAEPEGVNLPEAKAGSAKFPQVFLVSRKPGPTVGGLGVQVQAWEGWQLVGVGTWDCR